MDRLKEILLKNKKIIITAAGVIAAVLIVLCVTFCIRKKSNTAGGNSTTEEVSEENATTEKGIEPETPTEPETEKETVYTNPLTGEVTDKDYSSIRPYAIMFNTIKQALPQSGNSKADIYLEMAEEGGITRIMGLYQDITDVGTIGTIRSTREYYYSWVLAFDAIMVHAGGDSWVLDKISRDGGLTVDSVSNNRGAFWRDKDRLTYLSMEHTLYTSSENLKTWIDNSDIQTGKTGRDVTMLEFTDVLPDNYMEETAESVKVTFSGYKSTTFIYNSEKKKYDIYFWDNEPYMDEAAGCQADVTNIIILPVPNWTAADTWNKVRQKYNMSGGTGYYVSGGKYMEISWKKGDYNNEQEYGNPLRMTAKDGTPLKLAVGKTYICVMNEAFGVVFNE